MTNIETAALNNYLSDYPLGLSFGEVIQGIGEDSVVVWEPFENYDTDFIINEIESLKMILTDLMKTGETK